MSSPSAVHLLTLPRELRYQIYDELMQLSHVIIITQTAACVYRKSNTKTHKVTGGHLHNLSLSCPGLLDEIVAWVCTTTNPSYFFSTSFEVIDAEKTIFRIGTSLGSLRNIIWVTFDNCTLEPIIDYLNWLFEMYEFDPIRRCSNIRSLEAQEGVKSRMEAIAREEERKGNVRMERLQEALYPTVGRSQRFNGYYENVEKTMTGNRGRTGSF